jgi:hypothetical protein
MADIDDPRRVEELRRELQALKTENADLKARLQTETGRVRADTIAQVGNAVEDATTSLQRESSALRYALRRSERENESLRALVRGPWFAGDGQMVVRPHWHSARPRSEHDLAFLLMPFGPSWADGVHATVVKSLMAVNMRCDRADLMTGSNVMQDIWRRICECCVIVADLTGPNPNVAYELGLVDGIGTPRVLISQTASPTLIPSDLWSERLIVYSEHDMDDLCRKLIKHLNELRENLDR